MRHLNKTFLLLILLSLSLTPAAYAQKKGKFNENKIQQNQIRQMMQDDILLCKNLRPESLESPMISISKVERSSALRGGKYKVQGVIAGSCLKEGGLFENGQRVVFFPLETTMRYKRFSFEFEVNSDNKPEIRVFNINWLRVSKMALPKEL